MTRHAILIWVALLISFTNVNAQNHLKNITAVSHNNNKVKIEIKSYFYVFHDICNDINIAGKKVTISGNTINALLYYYIPFISHGGFLDDCYRTDTIEIGNILSDIKEIYIHMYTIENFTDTINQNSKLIAFLPLKINNPNYTSSKTVTTYPNPANSVVHFDYSHPNITTSNTTLVITDITGQVVKTMQQNKARRTFHWFTQDSPSGMYFYNLVTGEQIVDRGKIIIAK